MKARFVALAMLVVTTASSHSSFGQAGRRSPTRLRWPLLYTARVSESSDVFLLPALEGPSRPLSYEARPANAGTPSPNGSRIAFQSQRDGNYELYVMQADGSEPVNLSRHPEHDGNPAWSPDGSRIAFFSRRDLTGEEPGEFPGHLYTVRSDGSAIERLSDRPLTSTLGPQDWSPDGSTLLISRPVDGSLELHGMSADGKTELRLTRDPKTRAYGASYSADGSQIAYHAESDDGSVIRIMNRDGSNERTLPLEPAHYYDPVWSPDGRWLAVVWYDGNRTEVYGVRLEEPERLVPLLPEGTGAREPSFIPPR